MHFAIQGVGGVGFDVARRLRALGARVTAADEDSERIARARDELGVESVSAGRIYDVGCDVFVPCAMGGILHDLTIERLRCQAVAGSANNILAAPRHARSLAERGILVAPDFVINSGALILGANVHLTGVRDQSAAIDRIESELLELFERAARVEITPFELTEHIARERLMAPSRHGRFYFPHEEQA
jgi:leucine dehydrogenase